MLTAPVAVDDSAYVVNEDQMLISGTSVLDNDTDADNDPVVTATLGTDVSHGSLSLSSDGTFTYTPDANFRGTDFFTYYATDDQNETSATFATVTITVGQLNDAGVFGGDISGAGDEDQDITGTLTFSDAIDGFTTPDFTVSGLATNGVASIDATSGAWTYSPNANYHGPDSFTVSVTDDDGNVESQVIALTVNQVDDAGSFGGDTSGSGAEDSDITGTLTFSDAIDGFTTPDFTVSVLATNGVASIDATSGAWTYSPNANYHGLDSFTVSVTDDDGNVETQVIGLTITQVNDLGTFGGNTSGAGDEDTDITGTLTFSDAIDGFTVPDFTVSVVAAHGIASIDSSTGEWTYSPDANYHGADSFTVSVTDDDGNVETQVISLTVTQLNDAGAFGGNTSGTGAEDTDITGTLTFTDAIDGFTVPDFTVSVVAAHGIVSIDSSTGEWTYSPEANYYGADSFTVSVTDDDGNVETQVVSLTVTQLNDAGAFGGNTSGSGAEDSDITGTLTFTDAIDGFTVPDFTVSVVSAHGIASINSSTGEWTYSPDANYHGADSFTVSVTDDDGNVETQVISLTVTQVDDSGTFGGDIGGSGAEDSDITGTLTFSDAIDGFTTPDFSVSVSANNGVASIDPTTGEWTYSPNANYHGADSFTVSVTDDDGNVETQVITVLVAHVNDAGTFGGDISGSGSEDSDITGTLTFSDSIDGFTTPDFAVSVAAGHGVASIDPTTGAWTYTPEANYHGADSFTVSVTDDDGNVETQVISLTLTQVNDAGVFAGDTNGTGAEDSAITGTLTFADAVDGFSTPDFTVSVAASHGIATIDSATGNWTYTPDANYHGTDSFTVSVTDDDGNVEIQVVSLTLTSVVDLVAADDGFTISEDGSLTGGVTANDSTTSGGTLTYSLDTDVSHGVLVLNADGSFTYTPAANFHGSDSFTYVVTDADAGESLIQTVTITIDAVADLTATDDQFHVAQNTLLAGDVSLNDSTTSGGALTYALDSDVSHGVLNLNSDGSFTYTPDNAFHGTDSFMYVVTDAAAGESAVRTVTIEVADLTANDDDFSTNEDTQLIGDVSTNDSTVSGGTLTYALATDVSHGILNLNSDGSFTYTPSANYNGSDSFTYTVTDATAGESATRTVTLVVVAVADLTAINDSAVTDEDTLVAGDVSLNDSTTSGGTLTYAVDTDVSHGVLVFNADGSFTYTPATNFHGTDSFTYLVTDATAGESAIRTVTITVVSVNDAPIANPTSFSTNEDTEHSGSLTGIDVDNDTLVFAIGSVTPLHGTVTITPEGLYIYTPDPNYSGSDSFTFTVTDGTLTSTEATVTITVVAANDAPVADPLSFTTSEDVVYNGTLTASDIDGDVLVFSAGTVQPSHGTVVINPDGTFVYTPVSNYNGSDTFSFKVNDGTANSLEAIVTVTVTAVNDAPTVTNGSGSVNEDAFLVGSVSPLGFDVEGDTLVYCVVTQPAHGTLTLSPDGTFTYIPFANYFGSDSFVFRASDGQAFSADATFSINVVSVDDHLLLTLPGGSIDVGNNNRAVQIDAGASVNDVDTQVNYMNAQIRVAVLAGGSASDAKHGRVTLLVKNQGNGPGMIRVKGSKIYFDGSRTPVATFTGGKKGQPLLITFNGAATQQAVNAVLKQLAIQASKKATVGNRTLGIQVTADGQSTMGTKIATIS